MQSLVLVPGLNCTGEIYAPAMAALAQYAHLFIANVLLGATIGDMADAVLAAAPPRFALGGHSMGGYVAFEILRRAPERVTRLALVATLAAPDRPEQTAKRRQAMDLVDKGKFMAVARANVDVAMQARHAKDPAMIAFRMRMAEQVGADTYLRQQRAIIARADSRPLLTEIRVPTLVVAGADDQIMPISEVTAMAGAIPGARLEVIKDAGHFVPVEQPERFGEALNTWLES
ncbi:MAG: alpha/beta hydrolase [Hyphomicrobiaceae bacterium]|nr:alpha/beta hydrolase [Hyphomicrobiaceae bacterium]